jgi:hypothetical protein
MLNPTATFNILQQALIFNIRQINFGEKRKKMERGRLLLIQSCKKYETKCQNNFTL